MERQRDSMNNVWMVLPVTVIWSLIDIELLYNGSDDNSRLLYVCNWLKFDSHLPKQFVWFAWLKAL